MEFEPPNWTAQWKARVRPSDLTTGQRELFPLVLSGILPDCPQGQHLELVGEVGSDRYYCKADKNGTPLRATEWFFSSLAQHLNIPVPDFAPVRNPETGEVLFGSKHQWGTADHFAVQTFLTTPQIDDPVIGRNGAWLRGYLARLYVLDIFSGNPDRQFVNFLLAPAGGSRRLLAFDFASADLTNLSSRKFRIAETQTLSVGKRLRFLHGFDLHSAEEMVERIAAVPPSVAENIIESMPEDWLGEVEKGKICESWSNGGTKDRVAALRSGLRDESLL